MGTIAARDKKKLKRSHSSQRPRFSLKDGDVCNSAGHTIFNFVIRMPLWSDSGKPFPFTHDDSATVEFSRLVKSLRELFSRPKVPCVTNFYRMLRLTKIDMCKIYFKSAITKKSAIFLDCWELSSFAVVHMNTGR